MIDIDKDTLQVETCEIKFSGKPNITYEPESYKKSLEEFKERLLQGTPVFGELEHTNRFDVSLLNVSHGIVDIDLDENGNTEGCLKILETPKGKILKTLLDNDIKMGIEPRALGSVNEKGECEITHIITFDLVSSPN